MPMTLSVSSVANKAASASPVAAFSAQPASTPTTTAASQADLGDKAAQSANSAANANQTNASQANAADANNKPANPADGAQAAPDAFARMLDAQMGTLEGSQLGGTVGGDATADDKPAKPSKSTQATTGAASDPLPNPALLLAQVPVQPAQPLPPVATTPSSSQAETTAPVSNSLPANPLEALQKTTEGQPAVSKEAEATDSFAGLLAKNESGLQKLPQQQGDQSTNLPQQLLAQSQQATPSTQAGKPTFTISQPVGTPAWTKSLAEQMQGMVTIKAETAHIQLNPPELGPIDVTLKVNAQTNTAQVTFNADSAATRQALQDSLPRLHSMMAASGIQLGDAQVSSGQSQAQQQQQRNGRGAQGNVVPEAEDNDTLASIKAARSMLSIFA